MLIKLRYFTQISIFRRIPLNLVIKVIFFSNYLVIYAWLNCKFVSALLNAINARNIKSLREALRTVESRKYVTRLKVEYEEGKALLNSLNRIEQLNRVILELNKATMAEIRRYVSPPEEVHQVMKAALLLMEDDEGSTQVKHQSPIARDWAQNWYLPTNSV